MTVDIRIPSNAILDLDAVTSGRIVEAFHFSLCVVELLKRALSDVVWWDGQSDLPCSDADLFKNATDG